MADQKMSAFTEQDPMLSGDMLGGYRGAANARFDIDTLKTYVTVGLFVTASDTSDDITEGATNLFLTSAERTIIGNTSGTNTGDQDLSALATKANVLELDNTTAFTPDADYEPATKKYVDDNAGGGGSPAGADTQVQFNDSGSFGAIANLVADKTTGALTIGTDINYTATGIYANTSDGSDDSAIELSGGGASTDSRGANIELYGNEHATQAGELYISSGSASTGSVTISASDNVVLSPAEETSLINNVRIGGQAYSPPYGLTDGASIATDCDNSNVFTVTLGGNRTLANPTNLKNGATYIWIVKQDATGSRTLSYGTAFKWAGGGTAPTLSTGANAVDIITGVSDGTNVYVTSQLDFS